MMAAEADGVLGGGDDDEVLLLRRREDVVDLVVAQMLVVAEGTFGDDLACSWVRAREISSR